MAKYAIPVVPATLDLLQYLNGDVRPLIEDEPTWFIVDTNGPDAIVNKTALENGSSEFTPVTIQHLL